MVGVVQEDGAPFDGLSAGREPGQHCEEWERGEQTLGGWAGPCLAGPPGRVTDFVSLLAGLEQ